MAEGEGELQLISRSLVRCLPSSIFLLLKVGCQLVVMRGSGRGQGSPGDPCSAETEAIRRARRMMYVLSAMTHRARDITLPLMAPPKL